MYSCAESKILLVSMNSLKISDSCIALFSFEHRDFLVTGIWGTELRIALIIRLLFSRENHMPLPTINAEYRTQIKIFTLCQLKSLLQSYQSTRWPLINIQQDIQWKSIITTHREGIQNIILKLNKFFYTLHNLFLFFYLGCAFAFLSNYFPNMCQLQMDDVRRISQDEIMGRHTMQLTKIQ